MTNSILTPPSSARPTSTSRRSGHGPAAVAGLVSALTAAASAFWLLEPDRYPRHLSPDAETGSLLNLVDPTLASVLLLAVGLAGIALAARVAPLGRSRAAATAAAALAGISGLLLTDLMVLVTLGYACAILGPPALLVYLGVAAIRAPRLRWLLAAVLGAAGAGVLLLGADTSALTDFTDGLGSGLRRSGAGMLVNLVAFAGGLAWGAVALRLSGVRWWGDRPLAPSYVVPRRDWGWWATMIAVVGPLPYALVRLTWLTPWPALTGDAGIGSDPAVRIFGICLGLAAAGGAVLTLGLLARWGTTYPRWVPGVGGRLVSPTWPTVTALAVGVAITVAGRAMIQMIATASDTEIPALEALLLFPFAIWGPALVVAAVAYHRRRHEAASVSA